MANEAERKQRRGIRFPTQSLEEAVRVARVVQEQGGGKLSPDTTAVGLGLSSKSSSFIGRIASAKHFGLVEEEGDLLKTTALAKKILRPTNPSEAKQGLIEAFQNFHLFKQLSERFQNTKLPERPLLENILVREYGISDVSKGTAYDVFVESGKYAGQIVESEQGLMFGVMEKKEEEGEIKGREVITPEVKVDEKLVDFLENIGSLSMAFRLHSKASDDTKKAIESTARDLLDRALALASALGLPASKMSLKIASDRIRTGTFEGVEQFVTYFEEGVKEDLKLRGGK